MAFFVLVEVAGKQGIKQLITVFADAPEQNKEYQKRRKARVRRLCLRAVGELALEFCLAIVAGFSAELNILTLAAYERAQRALRGVCELAIAQSTIASSRQRRFGQKKKEQITARAICSFLVEVAGLELAASSTRNWRATSCATPR